MERLTARDGQRRTYFDNDGVLIRGANGIFHQKKDMAAQYIHDRFVALDKAIDRLAAYEDIGLEPLEIERVLDAYGRGMTLRTDIGERLDIISDIPTDQLKELAQAEKDGRLMVLPVKIGEILYAGEDSPALPVAVTDIGLVLDGPGGEDWERLGNIGKTVFLTREEAEAVLKKEEADNEAD